ncbi:MAG: hypothetical protein AUK47_24530 [Deltaproteobacteria bacterium CG2_30_63_29]|nr:MAG: hypothetical protein AUK47_24530 [Deltaproteobacteria bacterium CG2_30_63_29]PJB38055.1 MAG: hypothetical protein CO108_19655 [Deltaproteobacteria bacterium CG_4_9_14_3_um_filter_63_12]
MRRLNVILVVVASIATLVLVIEAIDWMITSDEEVIAAQFHDAVERERAGDEAGALNVLVDLNQHALAVSGPANLSFEAGDEDKLLEGMEQARQWVDPTSIQVEIDEDDVVVEGNTAKAKFMIQLTAEGRAYRQPVRVELAKTGERWTLTFVEFLVVPTL